MIFLRLSNLHIFFVFALFIYILGILLFNVDRGFDVTDESFYILGAMHPFDVFSVITHENYYNGLLFYLSGYNLAIFRMLGILVLLLSSVWFALELYRYIEEKYSLDYDIYNKIYFILVITVSSLTYYLWWLLTPSYNWLSLVSMILIVASMFRIINKYDRIKNKLFSIDYLYLGFSLSLLFMAKPTSLLALFPFFLYFLISNYKKLSLYKVIFITFIIFIIFILLHILFLDGGVSNYIYRLKESLLRISLLGGGHNLENIFIAIYENGRNIYTEIKKYELATFVFFSLLFLRYFYTSKILLPVLSYIFIFCTIYILYFPIITYLSISQKFYITILIFSILIISVYFFTEQKVKEKFRIYIQSFLLFTFLSYLSIAVSFGTNNNIWFHVNIAYIFPVAGIMSFIFVLDKYHSIINNIKVVAGVVVSLSVFIIINNAYQNPYRLNTSIKEQTSKVNILGGLKVDIQQKKYIDDLLKVRDFNKNTNEQLYLIDMTGGTPGVNIILGAKFFQQSWILGGYPGSNEFAYRIFSNISKEKLNNAWLLTAIDGTKALNYEIFINLNIDFPKNYEKVGTFLSSSSNEVQELWKPKNNLRVE